MKSDHPDFEQLVRRFASLVVRADSVREVVFRCCEPGYAKKDDLLTGEGSRKHGGRWNSPGSFATVYAAYSDVTALAEVKANYVYYGFDVVDALPRTIVAVDVKLAMVLDMTDGLVRKGVGVSAIRMRGDDWRGANRRGVESLTQVMGRAAYETGLEGMIVPACDGGKNLIWFPGNMRGASKVIIRNSEKLG
jgi:RES domain-containing protein